MCNSQALEAIAGCQNSSYRIKEKTIGGCKWFEWRELLVETQQEESHFNFLKMHLLMHFHEHIEQYGGIPMISTKVGETGHRLQIKEGYRASNKQDLTKQILRYYARRQALGMRILNLQALSRDAEPPDSQLHDILRLRQSEIQHIGERASLRRLCGRQAKISVLHDIISQINTPDQPEQILYYSSQNLKDGRCLEEDTEALLTYPAEMFSQLRVPVPNFQHPEEFELHPVRCTGERAFRGQAPRNDWVWVQVGGKSQFGALRGRLPAKVLCFFKIRDPHTQYTHQLVLVRMLRAFPGGGRITDIHGMVRVSTRLADDRFVVGIKNIMGIAHLIPKQPELQENTKWLLNNRIDLATFKEIYTLEN